MEEIIPILYNLIQKTQVEGNNSWFYEPKTRQRSTRKLQTNISWTDVKTLIEILANHLQQCVKIYIMTKYLSQICKDNSTFENQLKWSITSSWRNSHDHINAKKNWQNPTSFNDKTTSQKSRNIRKFFNLIKILKL